jgi:hypothetical protein
MTARQSSATERGLALIAAGLPLRRAAMAAGVAPSTLVRARARAGLPALQRGRPLRDHGLDEQGGGRP